MLRVRAGGTRISDGSGKGQGAYARVVRLPRPTKRLVGRTALAFVTLLAIAIGLPALFMAIATPPPEGVALPVADPAARHRVYVLAWGYHSSIFVEQQPGWRLGPVGSEDARFVEYGWGDRSFYMESNYCPDALFASAFLPTPTVVYVRGHDRPPNEFVVGGDIRVRECSSVETLRLIAVIEEQMNRLPDSSRPEPFPPATGYVGRFYSGREYYVVWWNCNEWTARMLANAGLASSSVLVGSPGQVIGRLEGFEPTARIPE